MIIKRKYWIAHIEKAWRERSIVWLSGVRRAGKTMLSRSLARASYFDCELPSVREMINITFLPMTRKKSQLPSLTVPTCVS